MTQSAQTNRTGFIGLGNIGKPMAMHLARSEFPCTVYDINPKACEELAAANVALSSLSTARSNSTPSANWLPKRHNKA